MKSRLTYTAVALLGVVLGTFYPRPATARADVSCCIYQGQYGLFCVNWNSGNTVDCQSCPRGPQDCGGLNGAPQPELPPQS